LMPRIMSQNSAAELTKLDEIASCHYSPTRREKELRR